MPAPALWGVIQMELPVIPQQSGCDCGYHALARALLHVGEGRFGDPYVLEKRLASFAIANGYSVIGEAFDAYTLAHVGNLFCSENGISAQCAYHEFKNEAELSGILAASQASGSVILFPYFPDKAETYFGPGDSGGEENAHWGALEPEEDGSAMLYEGNFRGSSLAAGRRQRLPPLKVTPGAMFSSNQSILPEFNWNDFLSQWGLDIINQMKMRVVVAPEAPNSDSFANEAAFTWQVRQVAGNIDILAQTLRPAPSLMGRLFGYVGQTVKAVWNWMRTPATRQKVSLKGALVEVRRR